MSKSWIVIGGAVLLSIVTAMGVLPSAFSEESNPLVEHSRNGAGAIIICSQVNLLKSLCYTYDRPPQQLIIERPPDIGPPMELSRHQDRSIHIQARKATPPSH